MWVVVVVVVVFENNLTERGAEAHDCDTGGAIVKIKG
jgi:hypothetical protein